MDHVNYECEWKREWVTIIISTSIANVLEQWKIQCCDGGVEQNRRSLTPAPDTLLFLCILLVGIVCSYYHNAMSQPGTKFNYLVSCFKDSSWLKSNCSEIPKAYIIIVYIIAYSFKFFELTRVKSCITSKFEILYFAGRF